jgi:redox-sensitive bicupin YhaK (pirin superfamily)
MTELISASSRGFADHGWLKSWHTFSFADYHNENRMGFGVLRVINEDRIMGGTGFSTHGHKDMEIISYVIEGALEHKDSMGNETVIKPGEVQRMSAGTGIRHSEHNHLKNELGHFLQIWILPKQLGISPGYGQKNFSEDLSKNNLVLVISPNGEDGSISINQDMRLYACKKVDQTTGGFSKVIDSTKKYWIQNIKGSILIQDSVGEYILSPGDALQIQSVSKLTFSWKSGAEFLLFEL